MDRKAGSDLAYVARTSAPSLKAVGGGRSFRLLCEVWRACRRLVSYYNGSGSRE